MALGHDFYRNLRSSGGHMIVRNGTREDVDALVVLLKELFSVEADFTFDPEKQRHGMQLLLDGCGKHRCIRVAEANRCVIGMATIQTLISTAEGGAVGLVEDVVVRKEWRGKGVGSELLRSIVDWAEKRGLLRLQLLADKNNISAINFYKKRQWSGTELICLRMKR